MDQLALAKYFNVPNGPLCTSKLNLNVISVEDPVEQILNGITQISVNEKAGINYESSFKAILRCDPDVILIGEIRDSTVAQSQINYFLNIIILYLKISQN